MRHLFLTLLLLAGAISLSQSEPILGILGGRPSTSGSGGGGGGPLGLLGGLLGGGGGLGGLLGNGALSGILEIVQRVLETLLCLLKSLGLDLLSGLVEGLSLNSILGMGEMCQEGGGELLGTLLGPDGLSNLLKDGLNIETIVNELLCAIDASSLEQLVTVVDDLGVDDALHLTHLTCKDGAPLFTGEGETVLGGLLELDLVDNALCLVKSLGAEFAFPVVQDLGLDNILDVYNVVCPGGVPLMDLDSASGGLLAGLLGGPDGEGILQRLLSGDLTLENLIPQLLCIVKETGMVTVTDAVDQVGLDEVLQLTEAVCDDGELLFTNAGESLLGLLQNPDGLLNLDLLEQLLCIAQSLGLGGVLTLLENLNLANALRMYEITCTNGQPLLASETGASVLLELEDLIGIDEVDRLQAAVGVRTVVRIANIVRTATSIDVDEFYMLICIVGAFDAETVLGLISQFSKSAVLSIYDGVCSNNNPVTANGSSIRANILVACGIDASSCLSTLTSLFQTESCNNICPRCEDVPLLPIQTQCASQCVANCNWSFS